MLIHLNLKKKLELIRNIIDIFSLSKISCMNYIKKIFLKNLPMNVEMNFYIFSFFKANI